MDINLDVLRLAKALAQHASQRQSLIAQNVANADTPGFRALDISEFSEAYGATGPRAMALRTTRPGHMSGPPSTGTHRVTDDAPVGAESPNGNTVSLEDQMIRSVETRQAHDLAMGVYSKTLDILRLAAQPRA